MYVCMYVCMVACLNVCMSSVSESNLATFYFLKQVKGEKYLMKIQLIILKYLILISTCQTYWATTSPHTHSHRGRKQYIFNI